MAELSGILSNGLTIWRGLVGRNNDVLRRGVPLLLGAVMILLPSGVLAQDNQISVDTPVASVLMIVSGITPTSQQSGRWSYPINSLDGAPRTLILAPKSDISASDDTVQLSLPVAYGDVEALMVIDDRLARRSNRTLRLEGTWKGSRFLVTKANATAARVGERILPVAGNSTRAIEPKDLEGPKVPELAMGDDQREQADTVSGALNTPAQITPPAPERATWIRDEELWMQHGGPLIRRLRRENFTDVFMTIQLSDDLSFPAYPLALAGFIRAARDSGINVWACIGDERTVLPGEGEKTAHAIWAYKAYNNTVDAQSRIQGIQLDISPQMLNGFNLQPNRFIDEFFARLVQLKPVAGDFPVDVNISGTLMQIMINRYDREAISRMADSFSIYQSSEDFENIASEMAERFNGPDERPIGFRLTLDNSSKPDGMIFGFEPAENGRLWLLPIGDMNVLILLSSAQNNPDARLYRMTERRIVSAADASFSGNPVALWEQINRMENDLHEVGGFLGVAVYGLVEF
jgi:hypothetical protein